MNQKGRLEWSSLGLTFTGKTVSYTVPQQALLAVSTGNERVELWGVKGRVLRMAIPYGGGIAMAGVMHHQVNALTVEFRDVRDGYHAAVFYLPAADSERVLGAVGGLAQQVGTPLALPAPVAACAGDARKPTGVLVTLPAWNQTGVPAAYRAYLYEHTVERLGRTAGVGHVYREGEMLAPGSCPAYTVQVAVSGFRQGSQVKRASMGPLGMFVGTTQMVYTVTIGDSTGRPVSTDELKATVRGEGESRNVADSVAKSIASRYTKMAKARIAKTEEAGKVEQADAPAAAGPGRS